MPHTSWNHASAVKVCTECNGHGSTPSQRRATINDPYPETACECGLGAHEPECEVCGYDLPVAGYDCLACDTVASLFIADLKRFDADAFAKALAIAANKALASERLAA